MSKGCYFVGLPFEAQLSSVLADEDVRHKLVESLANVNAPRTTEKSDVTDGDFYHQQRAKLGCEPHDLTVSMNADVSPIFKSANYAIWHVQLTLNELPPCLRWRSVILPLLWYGPKHPNMTLLLQAFATQMKGLAEDGITWNADGRTVNCKVTFLHAIFEVLVAVHASIEGSYVACGHCLGESGIRTIRQRVKEGTAAPDIYKISSEQMRGGIHFASFPPMPPSPKHF